MSPEQDTYSQGFDARDGGGGDISSRSRYVIADAFVVFLVGNESIC